MTRVCLDIEGKLAPGNRIAFVDKVDIPELWRIT